MKIIQIAAALAGFASPAMAQETPESVSNIVKTGTEKDQRYCSFTAEGIPVPILFRVGKNESTDEFLDVPGAQLVCGPEVRALYRAHRRAEAMEAWRRSPAARSPFPRFPRIPRMPTRPGG
jgi:hypothetical protein